MDALFFAGMIVFLIVLFMGIEYSNSRNFQKRMLEKLYQGYGRGSDRKYGVEEMGHIGMYYQKHRTDGQIDDITWNDLHMDELYQRINTSLSAAGDSTCITDCGRLFATRRRWRRRRNKSAFSWNMRRKDTESRESFTGWAECGSFRSMNI